jgi:hypothetical protein
MNTDFKQLFYGRNRKFNAESGTQTASFAHLYGASIWVLPRFGFSSEQTLQIRMASRRQFPRTRRLLFSKTHHVSCILTPVCHLRTRRFLLSNALILSSFFTYQE